MRVSHHDAVDERWIATLRPGYRRGGRPATITDVSRAGVLRSGLAVFFLLVIVEGAIRKWVLPQQQELVYLLKDVWLVGLICALVVSQRAGLTPAVRDNPAGALSLLYILWVLFEGVNPALPSLTLGLWGIRSHILYASLIWLVPAAFRSSEEVEKWFRSLPLIAIPVLVLGVVQFFSPASGVINRYAAETNEIATFGSVGAARVSGTFPYISGMAEFVFAVSLVALVLLLAGRLERRWRVWLGLSLAVAVTPMTGTRWGVGVWAVVLPVMIFETLRVLPQVGIRVVKLIAGIALVGVPIGLATGAMAGITALAERSSTTDDARERITGIFADPVAMYSQSGLAGFGAGATHQAASALVLDRPPYDWLPMRDFEGEGERLVLEIGLVGFLLALALKLAWVFAAHHAIARARTRAQLVIGMVSLGFLVSHVASTVVFNATAGALYWGFAGALACVLREQRGPARRF